MKSKERRRGRGRCNRKEGRREMRGSKRRRERGGGGCVDEGR